MLVLLAAAVALVALLGAFDPFDLLGRWLIATDTRMQPVEEDTAHIDPEHGDRLLATLRAVSVEPGRHRVVVFGNSQQFTASLPRGVSPDPNRKVVMASARLAATLESRAPGRLHVYNAASDNQNMPEALWQALYWFEVASAPPKALLLQLSFDTFRKTSIRPGYQTLLDDQLAGEAQEHESWSPEPALRAAMEHVPLFRQRQERRATFLTAVYALRVRLLGISPTSRRHITGAPYEQNFSALEELVELAQRHGARVLIYNAPSNPAIDMFHPDEYRNYLERLQTLCRERDMPFADLAATVPAEHWGYWLDAPDPIHFDEHGHGIVHERLTELFAPALLAIE